jgi:hypothetical protein
MSDAANLRGSQAPPDPAKGGSVATPPVEPADAGVKAGARLPLETVQYLSDKLDEAELLLGYAAEVGIEVKDTIRDNVLNARIESLGGSVSVQTAADLLTALTALAAIVRPVTVQSLRFSEDANERDKKRTRRTMRIYTLFALLCAIPILFFSLVAFIFDHFADKIKAEVLTGNALAVKLQFELGPSSTTDQPLTNTLGTNKLSDDQVWWGTEKPPRGLEDKDVLNDLQEFAVTMREIDEYARLLNHFLRETQPDPYSDIRTNREAIREKLEFKAGFMYPLAEEFAKKLEVYQNVRAFGNTVQENGSIYYDALATYILPVFYALLGAIAYLLRLYEAQVKNRTYIGNSWNVAHFLVAGIAGLVVGLFNNVAQGANISPFAEAFLAGYAVDVFFSFLEGLLQMFKRSPDTPPHHN